MFHLHSLSCPGANSPSHNDIHGAVARHSSRCRFRAWTIGSGLVLDSDKGCHTQRAPRANALPGIPLALKRRQEDQQIGVKHCRPSCASFAPSRGLSSLQPPVDHLGHVAVLKFVMLFLPFGPRLLLFDPAALAAPPHHATCPLSATGLRTHSFSKRLDA